MKRIIATAALLFLWAAPAQAEKYELDKSHSSVLFFINHLGFSNMVGQMMKLDGHLDFNESKPEEGSVDVTIYPASVRTASPELDQHLQKKDFFNTAEFPEIHFVSTGAKVLAEKKGQVAGNLTILGVTKPVTLNVTFNGSGEHPMTKNHVVGFSAETMIKRSDFGMTFGLPMVGDEVRIVIETEGDNNWREEQKVKKQ